MGRIRGRAQSLEGFSNKIRDIVAEKGTRAAAQKYGKSERTIRSWAKGTSAPNRYDDIIQKVNRSYSAQKPRWEPEAHQQKIVKIYGDGSTVRTGSILTYMNILDTEYNLSKPAIAYFLAQHEEGNVVTWRGSSIIPISDVRIIPAMSDPSAPATAGATAFGLTDTYYTGHKGKREEKVRGVVTQIINRAAYKTMGDLHKFPEKMTNEEMHRATEKIHLNSKVNKDRMPAIYLGYGDRD